MAFDVGLNIRFLGATSMPTHMIAGSAMIMTSTGLSSSTVAAGVVFVEVVGVEVLIVVVAVFVVVELDGRRLRQPQS